MSRERAAAFIEQYGRTKGFSRGAPRSIAVSPNGRRITFLRARTESDARLGLWVLELEEGAHGCERLLADPLSVVEDEEVIPAAEKARRERSRESGAGIVSYSTDRDCTRAVVVLGGRPYVVEVEQATMRELPACGDVVDPRIDPTGTKVAYLSGAALRVISVDGTRDREVASDPSSDVTWGAAEFVAAEEMGRFRGFWWSPDGTRLLAVRVDTSEVVRWSISDPADPAEIPRTIAYPAAGTPNALVRLALFSMDLKASDSTTSDSLSSGHPSSPSESGPLPVAPLYVHWDSDTFPYLAVVRWPLDRPPAILVQSRDQRVLQLLSLDASGQFALEHEVKDAAWVDLVDGAPGWLPDGRLVFTVDEADTRRLTVGGVAVTPVGLQVREITHIDEQGVIFSGSPAGHPIDVLSWRWRLNGDIELLTLPTGVHHVIAGGTTLVVASSSLEASGMQVSVVREGYDILHIGVSVERPVLVPVPHIFQSGMRGCWTALLLPDTSLSSRRASSLPLLVDPYGGPHAQRVIARRDAYLMAQWFVEQGYAVLITDGRGTPGRGPQWDRAIRGDLAGPALDDQVSVVEQVLLEHPEIDPARVAIRGWSFGGYLAALAVLRRPDVFRAAIAGAPVVDWRLYDTHYTERYLGHPATSGVAYEQSSLLKDAPALTRPLLLIHGLADDNVVFAHSLRLSAALFAAGRPHCLLPLAGATHMAAGAQMTERLLEAQLSFLHGALGEAIGGP